MPTATQVTQQFEQNIQSALKLSDFLESGQADTPLHDLLQGMRRGLTDHPFSITLLCINNSSRQSTLKWLYGHNFAVFSLQISKQVGLLEVQLKDRGYSLAKSTGEQQNFDQWDDLLNALQDQNLLQKNLSQELIVGTESGTGIKGLNVLMPDSLEFIHQSPALMTRLLRQTNVLMVAAPPQYQLNQTEQQVINTLMEDMACFIPLLPVDELSDDINLPEHGWWEQVNTSMTLPVQLLTTHVTAQLPSFLTDPRDNTRQALQLIQLSHKYHSACEAIEDQFEDASRQLNSRKKREQRKQQADNTPTIDHQQATTLRNRINDGFTELARAVDDVNRKRELIKSESSEQLKSHVESLKIDDMQQETAYKTIKLSLSGSYQTELMGFVRQTAKRALEEDKSFLHDEIKTLQTELGQTLNKQLGYTPTLNLPALDHQTIWHDLEQVVAMEVRYQGEMPKRGFFDRLGAGRQALMALMMAGMVFGSLYPNARQALMIFGIPLFLGGVLYSYFTFPKEERERLDKELKRVREEVLISSRRLIADINRQKISLIRNHLDKAKKEWTEQVDKLLKEAQNQQQAQQSKTVETARKRLQDIDQQLAQLQGQKVQLGQLRGDADRLIGASQELL
jgi:hypothetical protein